MRFIKRLLKIILIIFMLIMGVFLYSRYIEPSMLSTKEISIKGNDDASPCRIVFFTDTHFGKLYPEENIEKVVEKINSQKPDIVIFGGDFFDNYARDYSILDFDYLQSQLDKIESKYGKYAVFGNHDYGGGAVRIYEEFMSGGGFRVLKNENKYIDELKIRLIGYDDYLLGKTDESLYKIENEDLNIIISHEPDAVKFIEGPELSFILSGHSHGGQVYLPYITKKILPVGAQKYTKGHYSSDEVEINKSTEMFVSKGVGVTSIPYRFLNVPEIVVLDIK